MSDNVHPAEGGGRGNPRTNHLWICHSYIIPVRQVKRTRGASGGQQRGTGAAKKNVRGAACMYLYIHTVHRLGVVCLILVLTWGDDFWDPGVSGREERSAGQDKCCKAVSVSEGSSEVEKGMQEWEDGKDRKGETPQVLHVCIYVCSWSTCFCVCAFSGIDFRD